MDTDNRSKSCAVDGPNVDMDTNGAVGPSTSLVASGCESTVCDIVDDIIDAAVSSSLLRNCAVVATDKQLMNSENRPDDESLVCGLDTQDDADAVKTDVAPCDDTANSNAVSGKVVPASAENRKDSANTSSSSMSSTSSPDTDESDQFGGYTVNHVNSDSDVTEQRAETTADDAHGTGTDSGHTRVSREERARRKRLRSYLRRLSSSDSPTSSSSSDAESDIEAKTSRLDVGEEGFQLPADKWKPLSEMVERQYGRYRGRLRNPGIFTQRAGGSVSLANRLTLYAKHEVHEGCVNALHFNESG